MRTLRPAVFLLIAAVLAHGQAPAPAPTAASAAKGALYGAVVRNGTGEPLRKVMVRLDPIVQGGDTVTILPNPGAIATITGADGAFRFEDLAPGVYRIGATRVGYLNATFPPVRVTAGSDPKPLSLSMTSQSLLYGRVLDADGDPVPTASVQVLRARMSKGRRQFEQVGQAPVQADGSFVIGGLKPGRYYANANAPRDMDGTVANEMNVPTWFPEATDPAQASPINVSPGAEVRGIDLRMRKTRVFRVSGKAMDMETGGPARNVGLTLAVRGPEGEFLQDNGAQSTSTGPDGSFQFEFVAPGSYVIQTSGGGGGTFRMVSSDGPLTGALFFSKLRMNGEITIDGAKSNGVGRTEVRVADDTPGVLVRISHGADITGVVHTEDGAAVTGAAVELAEDTTGAIGLDATEGGKFSKTGIMPATYKVNVNGLPDGSYVKTIRFGGKAVEHGTLDLTSGIGGDVEIIVSSKGAGIAGVVHNADGDPAPGVMVQIYSGEDVLHQLETDTNGAFRINGLAPGDYRVIAWEQIDDDLLGDADFRARFENQSAPVKVAEGEHQGVELKQVGKEAVESEAAKVR